MKCKYWNVTSRFSLATSAIWNSIVWWPKTDSSLSCRYYRIKQVVKLRDNVIQSEEIYNEFWKTCFYAFFLFCLWPGDIFKFLPAVYQVTVWGNRASTFHEIFCQISNFQLWIQCAFVFWYASFQRLKHFANMSSCKKI